MAQATLRQLGAVPVPLSLEDGHNAMSLGDIDAAETTYIRVTSVIGEKAHYLNETFHSLFLTSILASDKFYKSLSAENKEALKRAAMKAGRSSVARPEVNCACPPCPATVTASLPLARV